LSAYALALAPGAFTSERKADVVALAGEHEFAYPLRLWLLPAQDAPDRRPLRFDDPLNALLLPIESTPVGVTLHLAGAAADLDKDGRDEAIFAMPFTDSQHCAVLFASVIPGPPPLLAPVRTLSLDRSCPSPDLLPVDADGDGWLDLALLTGTASQADRGIIVLWNDGHGGFSNADVADVGGPSVQAFTALGATPARPFSFAYVSDGSVLMSSALPGSRQFGDPETIIALPNASGIVAADVNGDGATDLVLAASGNLSIVKAGLKSP
jgi:hypothetical protein